MKTLNRKIEIKHINNPIKKVYQMHTEADLTNLTKLGFSPEYSIEKGIEETVKFYNG